MSLRLLDSLQSTLGSSCGALPRLDLLKLIEFCPMRTFICLSTAAASQVEWLRFGRVPFDTSQTATAVDRIDIVVFYLFSPVHMQARIQTLVREESFWTLGEVEWFDEVLNCLLADMVVRLSLALLLLNRSSSVR